MKLTAFKIIAGYIIFCVLGFLLSRGLVLLLQSKFSAQTIEVIVLTMPYCFVLIIGMLLIRYVKINNKTIVELENGYQNLYINNPNPLWIYDQVSLKFLSVNNAAVMAYGYTKEEFLGMTIKDIRPPEDYEKAVESAKRMTTVRHSSGMWRHLKKDGTLIHVNITSHEISFNNQDSIMVLASDRTEQIKQEQKLKQMNQVLQEEKQKLKETEKLAKVSGWEYFVEDGLLVWSNELYEIFDFDHNQLNYNQLLKAVHQEDLSLYNTAIENLLKHGRDLDIAYRFVTKTGVVKYVKILGKMYYKDDKMYKAQGTMQDITELKTVQLEKNTYLQRLKSTLNNITDGYFLLNREWLITAVNVNCEKLFGIRQKNLIGHHCLEIFPEPENTDFYKNFKKVLEEGLPVNFEEYSSYAEKWFCVNAYPMDEGAAIYFSDITKNKQKDFKLKQALERYDLVAKATNDVIYDHDVIGNYVAYSNSITDLLGLSLDSIGKNIKWWKNRIHEDDVARVVTSYKHAVHGKQENCGLEYRIKTSNDQYKYVYDQGYLQYDSDNNFVRMIGAIKDIDQLKRFDDENKRLADIITKVNNMIIIQDENDRITWVNKAFENFTGYTLRDVMGKYPGDILHGPETGPNITEDIITAKKNLQYFSYEAINYTSKQCKYWVNIEFTPLFTAEGKPDGYISIQNNITKQKEKEEKISRQNEILRNIAWMGSHELRRPVASILGLIGLINDTNDLSEKEESIRLMHQCTKHLDEIIHKINHRIEQEIAEE